MPKARNTDPVTSHEAAETVINVSATQKTILKLLVRNMSDDELCHQFNILVRLKKASPASESGIRSRRSELVTMGLVEPKGFGRSSSGRRTILWGVTNV